MAKELREIVLHDIRDLYRLDEIAEEEQTPDLRSCWSLAFEKGTRPELRAVC